MLVELAVFANLARIANSATQLVETQAEPVEFVEEYKFVV